MIEFGLLPSFVTTRQMSVLLRACHSRLIAPETSLALCIFAQPCGRPGCLAQILMNPNFGSNWGSFIILWRNDSRPFAMTWITVCISRLRSAGNHSLCNVCLTRSLWSAPAQQSGDGAFSGTRHLFSNTIFPGAPKSGVPRKPSGLPPQSKSESLL